MRKILALCFTLLLASGNVMADFVVLVHGYLGSPMSWERSGVNQALSEQGWQRAGIVFDERRETMLTNMPHAPSQKPVYSVTLPSKAPLMLQSDLLQRMLTDLTRRHPGEKATLVGHSAGGLVSRLTLVRFGAGPVSKLITIASPHLGTHMAVRALDETHERWPISMLKDFFGGSTYHTVKSSTGLLVDLVPPRPGNLLFWLNAQPHPEITYISVVRGHNVQFNGDQIIPGFSQDMNQVPALKGRAKSVFVPTGHELNPADGQALAKLL